jgi:HEAT repeat protein
MTERDGDWVDLDRSTPAGTSTVDYAVLLLRSMEPSEIRGAERWLVMHPEASVPALIDALETPSAQAAAVLLGVIGDEAAVEPLLAAFERGGEGLRAASRTGLEQLAATGSTSAATAIARLEGSEHA